MSHSNKLSNSNKVRQAKLIYFGFVFIVGLFSLLVNNNQETQKSTLSGKSNEVKRDNVDLEANNKSKG